jgi:hypothetical protein
MAAKLQTSHKQSAICPSKGAQACQKNRGFVRGQQQNTVIRRAHKQLIPLVLSWIGRHLFEGKAKLVLVGIALGFEPECFLIEMFCRMLSIDGLV